MLSDRGLVGLRYQPGERRRHADGRGLSLYLTPTARRWIFRFRLDGRPYQVSLGLYPDVSLAKARQKLQEARALVADGINPATAKRDQRRQRKAQERFEPVAQEWLAKQPLAPATRKKLTILFKAYLYPAIGRLPIATITAPQVLAAVRSLETRGKLESAHRTRQLASQVLRYGVATGRVIRDVTADLRGALAPIRTTHYAAVTKPDEIGALLRLIDVYPCSESVAHALKLAPLLFVRPGELRMMEWAEIDGNLWRIPAAKTKMRREHLVPLSRQALEVLSEAKLTMRSRYVFPSVRSVKKPLSDMALKVGLSVLGYGPDKMTPHGFRAMASTRLHELGFPSHVIERQLAHVQRSKVAAAYNRAEFLPERVAMMQAWADYLDVLRATPAPRESGTSAPPSVPASRS